MHTQRIGKIARLPLVVREELNRRIEDGESGARVLRWINELPEVREILRVEFGGKVIGKQNLWAWRKGGYRDWVMRRDAMELAGRLGEEVEAFAGLDGKNGKSMTEMMARWVTVHFAVASRRLVQTKGLDHWRLVRQMVADATRLRAVEQDGQRLRLQERKAGFEEKKLAFRRACWVARNGELPEVESGGDAEMQGMARVMEEMRREFFGEMSPGDFWEKVMKEEEVEAGRVEDAAVKAGQGESRGDREDEGRDSTQRLEGSKEGEESGKAHASAWAEGGSPPRRQDAKMAVVVRPSDQGGSMLIKEDGAPRRHEDSKDGQQQARGDRGPFGETPAVKAGQGESRGDREDEGRDSTRRLESSKEELAAVKEQGPEDPEEGRRQMMADDLFRQDLASSKALASGGGCELSFGEMSKREVKIYCPKCSWEPEQSSRWSCHCGCEWNTFETGGVCPDCGKAWEETACLSCHAWSRHGDWYHEFIGGREVESVEVTRELERAI